MSRSAADTRHARVIAMMADASTTLESACERSVVHARLAARALGLRTTALAVLQLGGYAAFLGFQLRAASWLGATGYGALAHALALGSFVALIGTFGSDRILVRELIQRTRTTDRAALVRASIAQRLLLTLPAAAVLGWVVSRSAPGAGLALPVACFYVLQALDLVSVFDSNRAAWLHVGGFAARNGILLGLLVARTRFGDPSPASTAWLMVAGNAAFVTFQLGTAVARGWAVAGPVRRADVVALLRLCWPLAIASASVQIYQQLPLLALGWVGSAANAGRYAIAAQLVFAIIGLIGLAYRLILPELALLARASRFQAWQRAWSISATMLAGSACVAFAAWSVAPMLIHWLKPDYAGSVDAFRVLLLTVPLVASGSVFGNAFLALGDVRRFVLPIACGVVVSVVACVGLVPAHGVRGAAIALVVVQATVVVVSALAFVAARPAEPRSAERAMDHHVPLAGGCRIVEVDESDPNHERHLARYRFASRHLGDGLVVDAACGTGYGTRLLGGVRAGRGVIGIDLSMPAVLHGRGRPSRAEVAERYLIADVGSLPLVARSVEVLVSFETIEHVASAEDHLREVTRVLGPGGTYVVSTPNRRFASPWRGRRTPRNRFHHVEWTPREFFALLERHFEEVERLGQTPVRNLRGHEARCFARGVFNVLLARPVHRAVTQPRLRAVLRAVYRQVWGADPAVVGPSDRPLAGRRTDTSAVAEQGPFLVEVVPPGCEPLVMVAVCRRPRLAPAPERVVS